MLLFWYVHLVNFVYIVTNMPPESFGSLLKKYRTVAGLTQQELAEKAGISTRGISDLERGVRRTPYKGTIELLADALKLSSQEREIFKKAASRKVADSDEPQTKPNPAVTNRLPLLGRTRELNQLRRFLAGEGPPVLMLTGEPGIGKTRLLNEVALGAVEHGWTILEGSCTRRGGNPFMPRYWKP